MNNYCVRPIAQTLTISEARVYYVRVDRRRSDQVSGLLEQTKPLMVSAVGNLFLDATEHPTQHRKTQTPQRGSHMRGLRTLFGTTAVLAGLALAPIAQAQLVVDIGVPPVCS